jgi:hypothetical protein
VGWKLEAQTPEEIEQDNGGLRITAGLVVQPGRFALLSSHSIFFPREHLLSVQELPLNKIESWKREFPADPRRSLIYLSMKARPVEEEEVK